MAGELYAYAVTHISGPVDAETSLDELLHGWGLPVPALTATEARGALESLGPRGRRRCDARAEERAHYDHWPQAGKRFDSRDHRG